MRTLCLAVALATAALCARAAAQADGIRLEIPDCAGVSGAAVRALVELEVAPRPVLAPGSELPAATSGGLECRGTVARIWVEDGAAPLRLEITLTELAPSARPRLLALALAELIATSRLAHVEQKPEPEPPQPAAAEPEPPVEPDAPSAPRASFQLWLALAAARAADPAVLAPSVAVGAVYAWDYLALAADLRYDRGRRTEPSVRLGLDSVSIALAPAWRFHARSYQLLLAPGVRLGYAVLDGAARAPDIAGDSVSGLWFGPCVQAAFALRFAEHWSARVGLELGYVTQSVRGQDASGEPLFDLGGPWISAQAGVSFDVGGVGE